MDSGDHQSVRVAKVYGLLVFVSEELGIVQPTSSNASLDVASAPSHSLPIQTLGSCRIDPPSPPLLRARPRTKHHTATICSEH